MIDINKLLEKIDQIDVFGGDEHEEYNPSACYEAKIEDDKFIFLIDNKEVATCSSKGYDLSYEALKPVLARCFDLMREEDFKGLKRFVNERTV